MTSHRIVHSRRPLNAETPPDRLIAAHLTSQNDFYVRIHGNVPRLDADLHRIRVGGRVANPLDLSVPELRARFAEKSVTATMQCAGNRRADMLAVRPVSGDPWGAGAIGNAAWTGVALADVLRAAGAETAAHLHVAFQAADDCEADGERFRFSASIPIAKAMSPEVLLAFAMGGEPLAPEHGSPLRVVVPGFAGVRSPKWLEAITVQDAPSDGHVQARDYKLFPPDVTQETADWERGVTINAMPLTSAICEPQAHAALKSGQTTLRGYATATARAVVRVDVSADGGRTWLQASLEHDPAEPWSWTLWRAEMSLLPGEHELAVRAWDSAGQTQPALPEDTWNFKGYLAASWHRIPVTVG